MNEEEQNRKFQLQMLEVSLKHEREVAILNGAIAVGVSVVVLGVTMVFTISLLGQASSSLGQQWMLSGFGYAALGLLLVLLSLWRYGKKIESSEKKDIDSIRQQFIEKPRTTEG